MAKAKQGTKRSPSGGKARATAARGAAKGAKTVSKPAKRGGAATAKPGQATAARGAAQGAKAVSKPAKRGGAAAAKPGQAKEQPSPQASASAPRAAEPARTAPSAATPRPPRSDPAMKPQLQGALVAALEQALSSARAAHHAAIEGATHEEARPENDKDTRGLEQSYLARGHAQRVADLEAGIAAVAAMPMQAHLEDDPITAGALIDLDEEGHQRRFFLAPAGGGLVLPGDVTVLTPTSPLGRALIGRSVGDECEVSAGGHLRVLTVVAIC